MTRVLVIDDSDDFRKLALRWFQSCGIEAEGAANGVQGLALQRARPADVIVTDIFMPEKGASRRSTNCAGSFRGEDHRSDRL